LQIPVKEKLKTKFFLPILNITTADASQPVNESTPIATLLSLGMIGIGLVAYRHQEKEYH
ncbi:MAG: hypothetical protein SAK42_21965, partial [Oscillatoria sp. PMC 1076.18]|nr:hypothetical protein [Oscillatoria sp. PMC 1076.18]